jgi:hypothetical protein
VSAGTAEKGFDDILAMKVGSVYGTAVQGVAGDQVHFLTFQRPKGIQKVKNDILTGSGFRKRDRQGNKLYSPGFSMYGRWRGGLDLLEALFAGSDALTAINNSDPTQVGSTHLMVPQDNIVGAFATLALWDPRRSIVMEWPSWKPMEIVYEVQSNGFVTVRTNGPADNYLNTGTVNTTTSMASVSAPTPLDEMMATDSKFRINAQGGSALADGDKMPITGLRITQRWGFQATPDGATWPLIPEPLRTGRPEYEIELTFERLEDTAREDELLGDTVLKADFVVTGDLLTNGDAGQNHELRKYFPELVVDNIDDNVQGGEVVGYTVRYRAEFEASAAPSGMPSGVLVPCTEMDNELTTALVS